MSYLFTLSPDVNTLKALGYEPELVPGQKPEDALRVNYASRLYDKDKADKLSRKYDSIMLKYGLREEADTLFFIVLSEFEQAFHRLSSIIGMKDGLYGKPFTKGKQHDVKRIADLLIMLNDKNPKDTVKFTFTLGTKQINIASKPLSDLMSTLITKSFLELHFPMDNEGLEYLKLVGDYDTPINFGTIDFDRLKRVRDSNITMLGADATRILCGALLAINSYVGNHTPLKGKLRSGANFTNRQLRILFDFARMFGWVNNRPNPANYISALLSDYLKTYAVTELSESRP